MYPQPCGADYPVWSHANGPGLAAWLHYALSQLPHLLRTRFARGSLNSLCFELALLWTRFALNSLCFELASVWTCFAFNSLRFQLASLSTRSVLYCQPSVRFYDCPNQYPPPMRTHYNIRELSGNAMQLLYSLTRYVAKFNSTTVYSTLYKCYNATCSMPTLPTLTECVALHSTVYCILGWVEKHKNGIFICAQADLNLNVLKKFALGKCLQNLRIF